MYVRRVLTGAIMVSCLSCSMTSSPARHDTSTKARSNPTSPHVVQAVAVRPFVATVRTVQRQSGWRMSGSYLSYDDVRVGPASFVLADGRRLRVDAGTRGGNVCLQFLQTAQDYRRVTFRPSPSEDLLRREGRFDDSCWIMGSLTADQRIAWFRVLPKIPKNGRVFIGLIAATDGKTVTLHDGLTWPLAASLGNYCVEPTVAEAVATGHAGARFDLRTRQVVQIECFSSPDDLQVEGG